MFIPQFEDLGVYKNDCYFYFRIHDFVSTADIVIQWKTLRLDPSSLHTRARGQVFASYARVPAPPTVDRTASIALAVSAPRIPPG
jgi:hypothetical protein